MRAVSGPCGPFRAVSGRFGLISRCVLLFTAWCAGFTGRWVALCHGDYWCARRVGGAVPCGLLVCASRGWRCAMRIAGVRVAWVALCHADCWCARRVGGAVPCGLLVCASRGGAVPCGLLVCASRGWRRVIGIADQGVVWVAPCHWDW